MDCPLTVQLAFSPGPLCTHALILIRYTYYSTSMLGVLKQMLCLLENIFAIEGLNFCNQYLIILFDNQNIKLNRLGEIMCLFLLVDFDTKQSV